MSAVEFAKPERPYKSVELPGHPHLIRRHRSPAFPAKTPMMKSLLVCLLAVVAVTVAWRPTKKSDPSVSPVDPILEVNSHAHNDNLIDGDIEVDETQKRKRQATTNPALLWPTMDKGVIPYYFATGAQAPSDKVRQLVYAATRFWQENTCLQFAEDSKPTAHIRIFSGNGCFSFLGKHGVEQSLSLFNGAPGNPGCGDFHTVSHELAHALGVNHQQTRLDRDSYIYVDFSNIMKGSHYQYEKKTETTSFNLPYDYGSVMHYSPSSANVDFNKPTMRALDADYQGSFTGQSPSFIDVLTVNKLYKCEARCNQPTTYCKSGGYPKPRQCNVCICPEGWGGPTCDRNPDGAVVLTAGANFVKYSINHTGATQLAPVSKFVVIDAPQGRRVEVKFSRTASTDGGCNENGIEIKLKKDLRMRGIRLCGTQYPQRSYRSEGNRAVILSFHASGSAIADFEYKFL